MTPARLQTIVQKLEGQGWVTVRNDFVYPTVAALRWQDPKLGEKEAALAEATRATELLPESKDAFEGPNITEAVAVVHCLVGDHDRAIALLDGLLSRPSGTSVSMLKLNPIWDPLRDDPRFLELLKKYGGSA